MRRVGRKRRLSGGRDVERRGVASEGVLGIAKGAECRHEDWLPNERQRILLLGRCGRAWVRRADRGTQGGRVALKRRFEQAGQVRNEGSGRTGERAPRGHGCKRRKDQEGMGGAPDRCARQG